MELNMAFPNEQLFLDRFITYNQDRYKDEPDFVTALGTLTLGTAIFTNFRKSVLAGITSYLVDVDSPNLFTGVDQKYTPADYIVNKVATLVEPDPLAMAELQARSMQGIYLLSGGGGSNVGAVLVSNGSKTEAAVIELIKASCLYTLLDTEITVDAGVNTVVIDSHTVVGTLAIVEADASNLPKYDGTYKYDGTIKY
jgi:hypothetical protein